MINTLKKIDRFLLPDIGRFHYAPYVYLIYLSIFFTSLVFFQRYPNGYIYAAIGTVAFLVIYFHSHWVSSRQIKWNILGILIIGSFMTLITPGASVFFVYAGAFCCRLGSTKKAFMGLLVIIVWILALTITFNFSPFYYVPAALFTLLIGGINIYEHDITLKNQALMLSQQEVRDLARTSERERIARDLHDLIGHTFSVITLKAELAGKLINKNKDKARHEISELEQISRDALKQVREVVTGYRTSDLNTELAHAKYVLESNEIHFAYQFDDIEMSNQINKELAIILKELVTNILKHAHASQVSAKITQSEQAVILTVVDDGVGFIQSNEKKGFGLKGIEERVKNFSGTLEIDSIKQTSITVTIPLTEASNND
ncbi:sensor histidine kinase [Marinicella sp. S1101]|uniref:sensor histidine kinase n=1 Tax=Marinicella marina TaxID=2996016 RepID=UPI002260C022|nr:sensor histidine kinase [Marinicella marina]MCX7553996.1 sensor histidine kinase [Marinicella marina]MDJ1140488.1 sensor histidine kinase [Marinicella marina]